MLPATWSMRWSAFADGNDERQTTMADRLDARKYGLENPRTRQSLPVTFNWTIFGCYVRPCEALTP